MSHVESHTEFQIPKFEAHAELLLSDSRRLIGKLFLPLTQNNQRGHASVLEWLNEANLFFPFLPKNSQITEILNKSLVVQIIVDHTIQEDKIEESLETTAWVENIEVHCEPYSTLTGKIYFYMPSERARVVDFLNETDQFFSLRIGKKDYFINKRFITSVRELPATAEDTGHRKSRRKK